MNSEKDILVERAKKIAGRKNDDHQVVGETSTVVEFLLTPERYALECDYISEVFTLKEFTPMPGVPSYVMGVINLRGRIVSIVNLKALFNLKERGLTELNKVILLSTDNMEFGIVADAIIGNKTIALDSLSKPPLTIDSIGEEYITGVTPDGLILLDASALLASKQLVVGK